jgi:hypothetical protein
MNVYREPLYARIYLAYVYMFSGRDEAVLRAKRYQRPRGTDSEKIFGDPAQVIFAESSRLCSCQVNPS